MADLIREGKILHWGISEATEEYLRRAHKVCPVTAVQNRYSMMARRHEELFPVLEELGIGFVAFSPLANGLLTDCYTADTTFDPATDYRASMPQFRPRASSRTVRFCPYRKSGGRASRHSVADCVGVDDEQKAVDCSYSGHATFVPVEREHRGCRYSFDRRTGGKHRCGTRCDADERSIRRITHKAVSYETESNPPYHEFCRWAVAQRAIVSQELA